MNRRKSTTLDPSKLMSPKQVCERLNVSRRTLDMWVSMGRFPGGIHFTRRVVRWEPETVEKFIREYEAAAQPA